jgi:3-deoxy-D-manno-octulosonate 8-phosphate phosphatase (KDO 8-P phosphatase)
MVSNMTIATSDNPLGRIKLLSLDVDGILTDGGIYYADDGNTYRKFNAKDGMGITQLMKNTDVVVTIISAGAPGAIEHRANRLKIKHVYTDVADKLVVLRNLCEKLGINMNDVAHMGDDVNDLSIMSEVGLSLTAADAVDEVLAVADIVTKRRGGHGAVREICDSIRRLHN